MRNSTALHPVSLECTGCTAALNRINHEWINENENEWMNKLKFLTHEDLQFIDLFHLIPEIFYSYTGKNNLMNNMYTWAAGCITTSQLYQVTPEPLLMSVQFPNARLAMVVSSVPRISSGSTKIMVRIKWFLKLNHWMQYVYMCTSFCFKVQKEQNLFLQTCFSNKSCFLWTVHNFSSHYR